MQSFDVVQHKGEFFSILETTDNSQVATMTIAAGDDSGERTNHPGDQIIYVVSGYGQVVTAHEEKDITTGEGIIIPAGTEHKVHNTGRQELFLFNVYTPPAY